MSHNILITGASGYLGGTLLARWASANLPAYQNLYALVRTDSQAEAVKQYGAEPISFNLNDETSITEAILSRKITIVYFLIDALGGEHQPTMIKALAEVKKQTGQEVHFLHTSGAKLFSSHAGHPTDRPLYDNDPQLYEIQKSAQPLYPIAQKGLDANNLVIETAEEYGVRSYIFTPCVVYGEGEGFGNKISIQTVAIVKAAKAARRVYNVDSDYPSWPVSHILDTTTLYLDILRNILSGNDIGHGKNGYYLAASGSVAWINIYRTMAKGLAKRQVVDSETVDEANEDNLEEMAKGLQYPKEFVNLHLGGNCTFEARHGREIGWEPQYPAEHILEAADAEVELILNNL
ncbi:hypothetical protein ASPWEDRAFT_44283 [Aspergillus wentii DTO 134E9]|uniref:NAD-dependent epimerase/dehydratase domain-containing protein n=1 Tax=Aspergillus wentii DTO 134E9 TaxID=1073089 RepID=A0A1L9RB98_ASPWE|nr:uncharacterized protein ASPWEDRAFT_44283 [Aspergillus wentii DTO 134E9]KAI9934779.1 hypothetical protein MW887_000396 [Aspergillus wentii]OJJ32206.1 hypothetical protein ASPWEDRAFT_44283 [Aspergillus wentii DTO 134E9]